MHQKGRNNKNQNHELKWQRTSQSLPNHEDRWSTSILADPNHKPNPNPNPNCYIRMVTKLKVMGHAR